MVLFRRRNVADNKKSATCMMLILHSTYSLSEYESPRNWARKYFSDTAIWALFWLLQQCQVVATIVARAHLYLIVYILVDIQHSLQHLTGEWCPFQKLLNFRDLSSTDSNLVNLCHGLGREVDARVFFCHDRRAKVTLQCR